VEKHRRTVDVMSAGREKMLNGHVDDASVVRAFVAVRATVDGVRAAQAGRSVGVARAVVCVRAAMRFTACMRLMSTRRDVQRA
jgi:hypothetical protein